MIFVVPHMPPKGLSGLSFSIPSIIFILLPSCAFDDGEDGDDKQDCKNKFDHISFPFFSVANIGNSVGGCKGKSLKGGREMDKGLILRNQVKLLTSSSIVSESFDISNKHFISFS